LERKKKDAEVQVM